MRRILIFCGYVLCFLLLNTYIHDFFTGRRSFSRGVDSKVLVGSTSKEVTVSIKPFPNSYKPSCEKAWRGDFAEEFLFQVPGSVVVVVSFCKGELDTLFENLRSISIQRIYVYSKCGFLETPRLFLERFDWIPVDVKTVIPLPNVGRVDHNVAHFIVNYSSTLALNDVVLFLEDNYHVVHQHNLEPVALPEMLRLAAGNLGFACRLIPRVDSQFSTWHETDKLHTFHMESYNSGATTYKKSDAQVFSRGENLGQWLRTVRIVLPSPVTPVCYGGNFAARGASLHAAKDAASRMELALRRGDNIVESHFAERTWAGLLMSDIPDHLANSLISMRQDFSFHSRDMPGMLVGCASSSQ